MRRQTPNLLIAAVCVLLATGTLTSVAHAKTRFFGSRTLRLGDHGSDVRRLQRVLTQSGVKVRADGAFGQGTRRRVRRYEQVYKERVDGRVDRREAVRMVARMKAIQFAKAHAGATTASASATNAFPVAGAHSYGDGFGARGGEHQGVDVIAACGLAVRAAATGTVRTTGVDDKGGNYVVLHDAATGEDHVYMHLLAKPALPDGTAVAAGQAVAQVGRTGDATGCHLHFEIWTAPGWYVGGHARDPAPDLHGWDGARR